MTSADADAGYSLAEVKELKADDKRVSEPLYTVEEAALYLGMKSGTLRDWLYGHSRGRPLVHVVEDQGREFIPFIGFAEATVTSIFRLGLSAQYIRKVVSRLQDAFGDEYALASRNLYVHGSKILYDFFGEDGTKHLIEVVSGNAVFRPIVQDALSRIQYGDGFATSLVLPTTRWEILSVDPRWASGQALTLNGGARMTDVLRRFGGGETNIAALSEDTGVPQDDLLELLRVYYKAPQWPGPSAEAA